MKFFLSSLGREDRDRFLVSKSGSAALLVCMAMLFLQGCASLPFGRPHGKVLSPEKTDLLAPYHDYSGVIHVHTVYSSGGSSTGSFEEVVQAAKNNHLDFVIITDHDTMRWLHEKEEGIHDNVLVIIGTELSTDAGHMAAMWIDNEIPRENTRKMLEKIRKQSGLSFICHAQLKKNPWTDWSLTPLLTGMEIFNVPAAAYESGKYWGLKAILYPRSSFYRSIIKRPDALLKDWDKILEEKKFVGIGAAEAHEKFRLFGVPMDSYDDFFKIVQTHVLAEDLSAKTFVASLRDGHVYVGFDIVAPVRNFLFSATSGSKRVIMGDSISYKKGLMLRVDLPQEGHIDIMKNGQLWNSCDAARLEVAADGRGVYRVEVYRGGKPWILSNPIYVR